MSDPITPTDAEGRTRRHFIRGVASAGASTVAASAILTAPGIADLLGDSGVAAAAQPSGPFADFKAIAASSADAFEVPEGYRAHVVIGYGDSFANSDGTQLTFGYNNDFLAFFPLEDKPDEGLLFVNHEYPAPFFQHGVTTAASKTVAQIELEQESVGNSVLHVKKDAEGLWQLVSPSPYNRRITGADPVCEFTGPLVGAARIGTTSRGSLANCSGGITPWGTALSCEENFQDYARTYGWALATAVTHDATNAEYDHTTLSKYGWVVETDPYDPSWTPRKHTALGRFRHENTAFRAVEGKPFVLYMGDDKVDAGVYKFVSTRPFIPGRRAHNLRILEEGTLYIAWFDSSRRTFARLGDTVPTSPASGVGWWREVDESELEDCQERILANVGSADFLAHFATNRPEDLEVDEDGTVYISFTNNTGAGVLDVHGAIRKLVEHGNDPTAVGIDNRFTWADYAGGGDRGADKPAGERGFSSCDNLVFDSHRNLWVVTDISSSSLSGATSRKEYYEYHRNNAVFMIPSSGPNAGVAFRFANMPVESEGTGPYFTPDEETLFVNVQHPGEETPGGRRRLRRRHHLHLVVAGGQQDDRVQPLDAGAVAGRGHEAAGEGRPAGRQTAARDPAAAADAGRSRQQTGAGRQSEADAETGRRAEKPPPGPARQGRAAADGPGRRAGQSDAGARADRDEPRRQRQNSAGSAASSSRSRAARASSEPAAASWR